MFLRNNSYQSGADWCCSIVAYFHSLSFSFLQIIPTNPRNLECDIQLGDMIHDRSGKLKPSLGISWHHRIATRIVLNYTAPDSSSVALQGHDIDNVLNCVAVSNIFLSSTMLLQSSTNLMKMSE